MAYSKYEEKSDFSRFIGSLRSRYIASPPDVKTYGKVLCRNGSQYIEVNYLPNGSKSIIYNYIYHAFCQLGLMSYINDNLQKVL